jgi:hypothetical protein
MGQWILYCHRHQKAIDLEMVISYHFRYGHILEVHVDSNDNFF